MGFSKGAYTPFCFDMGHVAAGCGVGEPSVRTAAEGGRA